ncbi:hypothetical protein ABB37_04706 [Leptomonas pyrrhocoris]|uniref:Uncharacterized protein n=1 Tax=Leptomonas pyrrhocoris TaxID=157538 RepID=A0A0N0DVJ9_LEPPY|nr:hypothetical protein ABB37_04706 [Leptomonas pyrrhocoris]KPA80488.1 hypothetical protein ABB37_04706 [Leptomonas pyrrhocoris]|eukprot:XP_015658927.1 hypothetical protein ABB37_04706 [Leptomonas pyrrhocoris]
MTSSIQEPDVRTIVAIAECVHALRQIEVKSCAGLHVPIDNGKAPPPSSGTRRVDVSQKKHAPHRQGDPLSTSRHEADRPSHGALPSTSPAPASTCSSWQTVEKDTYRSPPQRQGKELAGHTGPLPHPRVVQHQKGVAEKEEGREDDDLFSIEVSSLRYSWLHDNPRHAARRDRCDSNNDASRLKQEPSLKSGDDSKMRGERYSEVWTRQLNSAPLSTPVAPSDHVLTLRHYSRDSDGSGDRESARNNRGAHHPSSACASINLSAVQPPSVTTSARTESHHIGHSLRANDPAASSSRVSSSSLRPVGPPQRFQREGHVNLRLLREPGPADTATAEAGAGILPRSQLAPQEQGSISSARSMSGDSDFSEVGARQRSAAAASIASVRSTSPITVTAAAAARGEGSVASHGTGVSRVSIRSAADSLSNQNSPAPSAPSMPHATSRLLTHAVHSDSQKSSRCSSRSSRNGNSMRRDHHEHQSGQRALTLPAHALFSTAATRASQAAVQYVLDIQRRLSPDTYEHDWQVQAPRRTFTTSDSRQRQKGQRVHDTSDNSAAAPPLSPDAAEERSTYACVPLSHLNRTPHLERYTTAAGARCGTADPTHRDPYRSSRSSPLTSRPPPRLASPPKWPRLTLDLSHSLAPPLPAPPPGQNNEEPDASTEILRAAVHRMQQASSSAAVDHSAVSTPGSSSAGDRYALLVESARLLSSSVLVFTAFAPGDRQLAHSAARSASAADAGTPPQSRSQPRRALPLSRDEALSYWSVRDRYTASAEQATLLSSQTESSARRRGDREVSASQGRPRRSLEGGAGDAEREMSLREPSPVSDGHRSASCQSHCSGVAREAAPIQFAPLSATQLLYRDNVRPERRETVDAHEDPPASRAPRRYYKYMSPVRPTQQTNGQRDLLRAGLESPCLTSLLLSPLSPPSLASPQNRSPRAREATSQERHCGEPQTAESDVDSILQHSKVMRSKQPNTPGLSPCFGTAECVAEPRRLKEARMALERSSSGDATTTTLPLFDKDVKQEGAAALTSSEEGQHSGSNHSKSALRSRDGVREEEGEEYDEQQADAHSRSPSDAFSEQTDEAERSPPRARGLNGQRRSRSNGDTNNIANTSTTSASFSPAQLTPYQSTEGVGWGFEWVAEDFAAAHQRYCDGSSVRFEDGAGSPVSAPSASESRASAGHYANGSPLLSRCRNTSLSAERLSNDEFSASAAAPPRARRSISASSSGMPVPSFLIPPSSFSNTTSSDPRHPHNPGGAPLAFPTAPSVSFSSSLTGMRTQSTLSAERTPTMPSSMDAAALEMSTSGVHTPHAAALFADLLAASTTSVATVGSPPPPEMEAGKEGQDVKRSDSSGHSFTQSNGVQRSEDGPVTAASSQERRTIGASSTDDTRLVASMPHGGSSAVEDGDGDVREPPLQPPRQSTQLHGNAPYDHRCERCDDRNGSDGRSDADKQCRKAIALSSARDGAESEAMEDDAFDDTPPRRSGRTFSPAPVICTHGGRRGEAFSNDGSSIECSTTLPAQAEWSEASSGGEPGLRRSALSATSSSSPPPTRETTGVQHRSGTPTPLEDTEKGGTRPRPRHHHPSNDDEPGEPRCSSPPLPKDDRMRTCNSYGNVVHFDKRSGDQESAAATTTVEEKATRRKHPMTSDASTAAVAKDASPGQTEPEASPRTHHDVQDTVALLPCLAHLPPPLPPAKAAASRTRLSVPGALSKPPMAPTSHRPRLATSTRPHPILFFPAPTAATSASKEERRRDVPAAAGDAERGHASSKEADYFDAEDDGCCGYEYDVAYMEV